MTRLLWIVVLLFLWGVEKGALSAPIKSSILQYRYDRLYFSHGEESYVFPAGSFVVLRGEDTLYHGRIDRSVLGVSYSAPTGGFFDTLNLDSLEVLVEACEVDSAATIVLGTTGFGAFNRSPSEPVLLGSGDTLTYAHSRGKIHVLYYSTRWEMQLDLESGRLDGCFSYRNLTASLEDYRVMFHPAPYFAVLRPSVADAAEDNMLLTTSLYYRFDNSRQGAFLDGERVIATACLTGADTGCVRSYVFDPAKGRNLLRHLRMRNRRITIAAEHENLEEIGLLFSDILSRDRYRTRLEVPSRDGDCYLQFVSSRIEDPLFSLRLLCENLTADTTDGNDINQTIALLNTYVELAENATDTTDRNRFIRLVERGLREDVGVFPLFRPTVYFTVGERLRGESFDSDGFLLLDGLVKLKPLEAAQLEEGQ